MSSKIVYTEGDIGDFEVVPDFLPSPAQLAEMESNVKVTINLRKSSVDFFKSVASKNHVRYQRVIRSLLDSYVGVHSRPSRPSTRVSPTEKMRPTQQRTTGQGVHGST